VSAPPRFAAARELHFAPLETVTEDNTRVDQSVATTARFAIDIASIERSGRSFEVMVEQRLCEAARRRLGEVSAPDDPTTTADAGGVAGRSTPARLLALIQRCCDNEFDYLRPDLTLLEACFRVFLLNGNAPLTVGQLRAELEHWPGFADRLRPLSDEQVSEMLTRDRFYGIRQVVE
jgi:hypothetical protein